MPSPETTAQVDALLNSAEVRQRGYSEAQIGQLRTKLLRLAGLAEAGDQEARRQLEEDYGIVLSRTARSMIPGYTAYGAGLREALQPSLVPAQLMEQKEQLGVPTQGQTEGVQRGYEYLGMGQVRYIDTDTGRAYYYQMVDKLGYPTDDPSEAVGLDYLRSDELLAPTKATTPTYSSSKIRDLQAAIAEEKLAQRSGWQDRVQSYQESINAILAGYGATGGVEPMSAYQAGQLDISRQRLGLDVQKAERDWQETLTQAARTAQPLTYLSLLRGAYPGQGGTDIYQGVKRIVPSLLAPGTATTGEGWKAPLMPPAMATIQSGGVLKPVGLPSGIKAPGVQAQANLTPTELEAEIERMEYQGVPRLDVQKYLRKTRTGLGQGLSPPSYGGINVRR